jgi:redox-sensitive bicupin YhaK (pirin superfamily)
MFGIRNLTTTGRPERVSEWPSAGGVATPSRRIALLRSGRRHGPLTRLITPWDVAELTQPFVFLGHSEHPPGAQTVVGAQPGIATLTLVLSGVLAFEDARGNKGTVVAGGFRWMTPGEVVWHAGCHGTGESPRAIQLWVETTPSPGNAAGGSQCVAPHEVQVEGPVRVLLGQLGRARSPLVHAPPDINYFHIRLKDGECWRYAAPAGHNVAWIAVDRGGVRLPQDGPVSRDQLVLFGDSRGVIEVRADGEGSFVLGSARRVSNARTLCGREPFDETQAAFVPRGSDISHLGRRLARGKRR